MTPEFTTLSRLCRCGKAMQDANTRHILNSNCLIKMNYPSVSLEGATIVTSSRRTRPPKFHPSFWAKHPTRSWAQVTFPKSEVGIYDFLTCHDTTTSRGAIQDACVRRRVGHLGRLATAAPLYKPVSWNLVCYEGGRVNSWFWVGFSSVTERNSHVCFVHVV